jgi:4-hydroxybenzoate polyprenyltransferase
MNRNKSEQSQIPFERASKATDIVGDSILLRKLPSRWLPYARLARLDRPIGTWLLLIPCWQGLSLAIAAKNSSFNWEFFYYALLFGAGAIVMRAAGCTLNDIADRHIDGKIARTALRPIPSGEIKIYQALIFMLSLLIVGAVILFQFNTLTIVVGLASVPFAAIYPFMKRFTWWPQFFLGLAFNWGTLVGWTAIVGELSWAPVILYLSGIMWTLGYDTIYAHQDKEDDALVGVKSTARLFQDNSKIWLFFFYSMTILGTFLAGLLAGLAPTFLIALMPYGVHLITQVIQTNLNNPLCCLATFKSNRNAGFLMLTGLMLFTAIQS